MVEAHEVKMVSLEGRAAEAHGRGHDMISRLLTSKVVNTGNIDFLKDLGFASVFYGPLRLAARHSWDPRQRSRDMQYMRVLKQWVMSRESKAPRRWIRPVAM